MDEKLFWKIRDSLLIRLNIAKDNQGNIGAWKTF